MLRERKEMQELRAKAADFPRMFRPEDPLQINRMLIAVNCFEIDAALRTDAGVIGPRRRLGARSGPFFFESLRHMSGEA